MESFVLKGYICYCESKTKIIAHENAYVVCIAGISQDVFAELLAEYRHPPVIDHGDKLHLLRL